MSLANSKRLYEHYVKIGYDKAAEDMLKHYPEFAEKPKEKEAKHEKRPNKVRSKD